MMNGEQCIGENVVGENVGENIVGPDKNNKKIDKELTKQPKSE